MPTTKIKYLTVKEQISYIIAAFGRSGIYSLMSMFLLIFYTDAAQIKPVHAGIIIVACRIFDGFNDPIMGIIVDKTRSKWGKMRPYLLFSPIPVAITTILMFFAPNFASYGARVAYAAITYCLWGIAFTIQDVPFWGMSSVITPLESERNSFLSTSRLGSTFGGILPTLLIPILRDSTKLGQTKAYFIGAIIFAVLGACLSVIPFFTCKERVDTTEKPATLRETFKVLAQNKVLIIMVISSILGSTMVMANISASYIATYLIEDKKIFDGILMTAMSVAIGIGMVPSMLIMPLLRKKFDLKQIYIGSSIFGIIAHVVCWFVGYSNVYVFLICLIFMGIPLGIYNVITYAIIADSVDYLEWKTGKSAGGICFSFQTLLSKINAGIASLATSVVLSVCAFQKPINDVIQTQSDSTKTGLFFMVTILPAIGFLLAIIPMLFNDFTGEKKKKAIEELQQRRKEKAEQKTTIAE